MDLMGIVLVLMETIMVSVLDSIGGMLNPIGKMPKTHYKKNLVTVLLKKANGL